MNPPKISIIVPVYKVEKYLQRCLDSIISQTFTDWECILIDDGSPDNSGKICDEYAEKDKRFRVIHQENAGVSAARNAGLDCAGGEWVTFVDSDDWVENEMLSVLYQKAIEQHAEIIICGCKIIEEKEKSKNLLPKEGWLEMPNDIIWYMHCPWGKIYLRSMLWNNNLRFPLGIALAEDLCFTYQTYYLSKKIYGINKPYYNYFQNVHSITKSLTEKEINDHIEVIKLLEQKYKKEKSSKEWAKYLDYLKSCTKDYFLFNLKNPRIDLWRSTFPETSSPSINDTILYRKYVKKIIEFGGEKIGKILLKFIYRLRRLKYN